MEYDRALYRVYERAMEDLSFSGSTTDPVTFLPPCLLPSFWNERFQGGIGSVRHVLFPIWNNWNTSSSGYELSRTSSVLDDEQYPSSQNLNSGNNSDIQHVTGGTSRRRRLYATGTPEELSIETRNTTSSEEILSTEDDDEQDYSDHDTPQIVSATRRRHRPLTSHRYPSFTPSPVQSVHKLIIFMRLAFWLAVIHIFMLMLLHQFFISNIKRRHSNIGTHTNTSNIDRFSTCIEYALATRPIEERMNRYFALFGNDDSKEDDDSEVVTNSKSEHTELSTNESKSHLQTFDPPLLFPDEILQIKIVSQRRKIKNDELTTSNPYSRVHKVRYDNTTDPDDDEYSTPEYWNKPTYQFATNQALLYLDDKIKFAHNITTVNLTLSDHCLSIGRDDTLYSNNQRFAMTNFLRVFATYIIHLYDEIDTVVINQLMYGIRSSQGKFRDGSLKNLETSKRWFWNSSLVQDHDRNQSNIIFGFIDKIGTASVSILLFFLVTSATAVLVRVLTTSGVAMMFPLFALFRIAGMSNADDRILLYSYPWIGHQRRAMIRSQAHSQRHFFVAAHVAKMFLLYILYEAAQSEWSVMFYGKGGGFSHDITSLWIFGFFMLVEYFSLLFVRSALGAYFFSRMTLLYFLGYHFYFYSVPYGFYDLALVPWFCLMIHTMIFTILALEYPALSKGAVCLESPREVYTKLSWSEFSANLPHEFTVFLPLNSRYIPIHDRRIVANRMGQTQMASINAVPTNDEEMGT